MKKKIAIPVCVIAVIGLFLSLWYCGVFVTDRSAKFGVGGLTWNGKSYSPASGDYTEGRTIAKTEDGSWDINEVKEDPSYTFVVVRSFLDQRLFVADDYDIPTSGEVTKASWNGKTITDPEFLSAVSEIEAEKTASFSYETEGIFMLTDTQKMRALYFAYEDCPVATQYKGYLGKVGGKWAITTDISSDQRNDDGSPKPYTVSCYSIPDQYASILEQYFS